MAHMVHLWRNRLFPPDFTRYDFPCLSFRRTCFQDLSMVYRDTTDASWNSCTAALFCGNLFQNEYCQIQAEET